MVSGTRIRCARPSLQCVAAAIAWLAGGALAGVLSCGPGRPTESTAGAETRAGSATKLAANRRLIERYFGDVWSRGDVDVLDDLLDPAYVNHTPSTPDPPPGPAGLKPIVRAFRSAFPDLRFTIDDVVVTPDHVVARVTMTGTHLGSLFGLPPTGRRVEVSQINIERVRDGRIVEHWRVTDELALMRQLGAVR